MTDEFRKHMQIVDEMWDYPDDESVDKALDELINASKKLLDSYDIPDTPAMERFKKAIKSAEQVLRR